MRINFQSGLEFGFGRLQLPQLMQRRSQSVPHNQQVRLLLRRKTQLRDRAVPLTFLQQRKGQIIVSLPRAGIEPPLVMRCRVELLDGYVIGERLNTASAREKFGQRVEVDFIVFSFLGGPKREEKRRREPSLARLPSPDLVTSG